MTHKFLWAVLAVQFLIISACISAERKPNQSYEKIVNKRIQEALSFIQEDPWPSPTKIVEDFPASMALLLLSKNEKVAEANQLILTYCAGGQMTTYAGRPVAKPRCESLYRIYLLERTRKLLSPEARKAIEQHAWGLLTQYNRDISLADASKSFWGFTTSENHWLNDHRRYTLALQIVRMAKDFGPQHQLNKKSIEFHCQAWLKSWIRYFRERANEGVDVEVAHPSSYGQCTAGVYYDLYDLIDDAELHKLAGNYLTLFWAEVASEFEPRTGQRAGWACTRNPFYDGKRAYWAKPLLYCYTWHDNDFASRFLGLVPFLTSSYRPPEILSAITRDPNRGSYLATARRPGLVKGKADFPIIFDKNGDSHLRRDVYYTPDYTLSTMSYDPKRDYKTSVSLAQTMGATFAADQHQRITVMGKGYYAKRAISGITGKAVSIVSRDPKAVFGKDRFKSDGTCVFISNGDLWKNRVEDASGWFFTHSGGSYVAILASGQGYRMTTKKYEWPNREFQIVEETAGHYLELKDMWAPIIIQMGRAVDYKSFEAFCASVKSNPFAYDNGKLSYTSEAKDTYDYWAKGAQFPQINGTTLNLNPAKTYDTPYLSMVHGENRAVISYPGYKDVVLDFDTEKH